MTAIDWTKPVETVEDPPRPVRVLCTDHPGKYPIIISVPNTLTGGWSFADVGIDGTRPNLGATIRNVAPSKPEPVLREVWVSFDGDNGWAVVHHSEQYAASRARNYRGVYARAAIMSDGSPVDEDPTRYGVCEVCVEKAVKSVVETAVIYCTTGQDRGGEKLLAAVEQYIAWEKRND